MSTYEMDLAVARGAAMFDAILPDWAEEIDVSRLNMSDSCNCIGGQLCGVEGHAFGYEDLADSFRDSSGLLASYGFCLPPSSPTGFSYWHRQSEWEKLTRLWKQEIDRRLP